MQGPKYLFEKEDRWVTEMGAWIPGERVVFRGKDLFQELGDLPWMGLLLYGITGRVPNEKQIRLFEGMWSLCTSYPDPRLWNNRVAALAGTSRSTAALAISAANAVSEASIYGHRPNIQAIDFLIKAQQQLNAGINLTQLVTAELKKHRIIPGYGRPVTRKDERVGPLMALAEEFGFSRGPYVELAFTIEKILLKGRWRLYMNIAAVAAALAADQGLTRHEYYCYVALCFSAGMFPCYLDAANKPEGTFFPFRCDRIVYEGVPRRCWTRQAKPKH